jgi:hypothetical protein
MKKILMGIIALSMLTVTSCKKKDKEPENITPTTSNLSGSYKTAKVTGTASGSSTEIDITNTWLDACEKDDIITLNANGTYTVVDAGTTCSPTSADTGTWSLVNSTTINIDGSNNTIKRFNGTNLDISFSDPSAGTVTIYLVKQ